MDERKFNKIVVMNEFFPGYYPFADFEYDEFCKNAIIVLDDSVLLDLFRIDKKYVDELFKIISKNEVKNRLWLPYDIAWFYHKKMNDTILDEIQNIDTFLSYLTKSKAAIDASKKYPYLDAELSDNFITSVNSIKNKCEEEQNILAAQLKESAIKNKLKELFHRKVGPKYEDADLDKVYNEGAKRFSLSIPPGYMYEPTSDSRIKYHELIIWKQMLKYAQDEDKNILFVTSKVKEDWFYIRKGKIVSPRHELINEFLQKTQQRFFSLSFSEFVKKFRELYEIPIDDWEKLLEILKENILYASVNTVNVIANQVSDHE